MYSIYRRRRRSISWTCKFFNIPPPSYLTVLFGGGGADESKGGKRKVKKTGKRMKKVEVTGIAHLEGWYGKYQPANVCIFF
jgi:hypothetical protein